MRSTRSRVVPAACWSNEESYHLVGQASRSSSRLVLRYLAASLGDDPSPLEPRSILWSKLSLVRRDVLSDFLTRFLLFPGRLPQQQAHRYRRKALFSRGGGRDFGEPSRRVDAGSRTIATDPASYPACHLGLHFSRGIAFYKEAGETRFVSRRRLWRERVEADLSPCVPPPVSERTASLQSALNAKQTFLSHSECYVSIFLPVGSDDRRDQEGQSIATRLDLPSSSS